MESKYCTGIEDVREKSGNFVGGQGKLQMSSNFCSSIKQTNETEMEMLMETELTVIT